MEEVRIIDDVLAWDLVAMNGCRKKINACCGLLMQGSSAVSNIKIPSEESYYITTFKTIAESINTSAQTLINIKNALINDELELENAEKQSEEIINEIFDKYFNEGWSIGDILKSLPNRYFRDDITYEIEKGKFRNTINYDLLVPSSAYDGEAKPIVFILAGKSGVVSTNVENNIKDSGLEKFDGYTVCLDRSSCSEEQLSSLMEELSKEGYNIDKSNITFVGYSQSAPAGIKSLAESDFYRQVILLGCRGCRSSSA